MHISDGVLGLETTLIVSAISLIALVKAVRELKNEDISLTSVASAMFFIASFIFFLFFAVVDPVKSITFAPVFLNVSLKLM